MKTTIEKELTAYPISDSEVLKMLLDFNSIVQLCTKSKSMNQLSLCMSNSIQNKYFAWGFGSSHMWVHQKTHEGKIEKDRLLIIEEK